jgi:flagellar motility protein MotE (MotC chaperone)
MLTSSSIVDPTLLYEPLHRLQPRPSHQLASLRASGDDNDHRAQLETLRAEMEALEHERVVCEVLTRPTINACRHQLASSRRAALTNTKSSVPPRVATASTKAGTPPSAGRNSHSNQSRRPAQTLPSAGSKERDEAGFLTIPGYNSPSSVAQLALSTDSLPRGAGRGPLPHARSVRGLRTTVVPSVRTGSLPEELQDLLRSTTPSNAPPTSTGRAPTVPLRTLKPRSRNINTKENAQLKADLEAAKEELDTLKKNMSHELNRYVTRRRVITALSVFVATGTRATELTQLSE